MNNLEEDNILINFDLEFEEPFQPEMNEQFETNSLADFEDENGDVDDCTDDDESRIANLEKFVMDHEVKSTVQSQSRYFNKFLKFCNWKREEICNKSVNSFDIRFADFLMNLRRKNGDK